MKKLRYRFILITMISVVVVLFLLLGTISLVSYSNGTKQADELLVVLSQNGGSFNTNPSSQPGDPNNMNQDNNGNNNPSPQFENKETPYETRYFTVSVEDDEYKVNLTSIVSVDEATAITMAQSVLNKKKGYKGNYRYLVTDNGDGKLVIFLDNTRSLNSVKNFIVTGAWVSLVGVAMVFVLVFLLSKRVFAPVQKSYEKQKRFITNSSHELKTPLTIISANNELLEMEYGKNESTDTINHQVGRMSTMVKNMVSLARLDESENLQNTEKIDLTSLLEEAIDSFIPVFEVNNKKFTYEIDKSIYINGNTSLISQMLYLLLDNANKYALTQIKFKLTKNGKYVLLETENDAEISEKDGNVFLERFYRADDSRKKAEGSGIGLSLVQEIVSHHKGNIKINVTENSYKCVIKLKSAE